MVKTIKCFHDILENILILDCFTVSVEVVFKDTLMISHTNKSKILILSMYETTVIYMFPEASVQCFAIDINL